MTHSTRHSPPRILVVEDSRTQAIELSMILEASGYAVELAPDGSSGLARARTETFDMVLSDIVMPGMNGYELCETLKREEATRGLPVILLTTLTDPMDVIRGLGCGADNFITKPYDEESLISRVEHILANQRLRDRGRLKMGVEISFLGERFTINSDKEQILDLLISTFEDIVRTNQKLQASRAELAAAKATLERYADQLEGRVESSEGRYQRLLECASDGVVVLDAAGLVREANPRAAVIFGRPAEQLRGLPVATLVAEDQRQRFADGLSALSQTGLAHSGRYSVPGDGEPPRGVDISVSVAHADDHDAALLIARDVTEAQQLEEQMRSAQRLESVARLAAGVAHDFNNLLTVVLSHAELALEELPGESLMKEDLETIRDAGSRAAALTSQLLTFSRRQARELRPVDLNAAVRELDRMVHRLIGEDVRLVLDLDSELGFVQADPVQVDQVLMNLAVNARDAMPEGGELRIATRHLTLSSEEAAGGDGEAAIAPGDYVLLAVADSGVGMDSETRRQIFEPFFTTKPEDRGTGLGLSTVYGIVKQSGGHIRVRSAPGEGTTFEVLLPAHHDSTTPPPVTAAATLAHPEYKTLLVVEDEDLVRHATARILKSRGHSVLEAQDARSALLLAERYAGTIDALVTDVVLPDLDGVELYAQLRRRLRELRVLYLSGYAGTPRVTDRLPSGAPLLAKPFASGALLRKLDEVLAADWASAVQV